MNIKIMQTVGVTKKILRLALILLAINTHAKDRDTPQDKLQSAKQFVQKFLVEDANPKQVFFHRDVSFPSWKDQPLNDCAMQSYVRAIEQKGEPRFEDSSKRVVLVPVVAELLMVEVQNDGGPKVRPGVEQYSWCSFEYERYSFVTGQFEKISSFRNRAHNDEFPSWGEARDKWRSQPLPPGLTPDRYVLVDMDKRYVRYFIRVNVSREQPHRLWPQVPRHWYAKDVIVKLDYFNIRKVALLASGASDRGAWAKEAELADDLNRMKHQLAEDIWVAQKLSDYLQHLESIPSFSDIKL